MHYGSNKRDVIEEKLHKIIEKLEKEPDKDEIFCLSCLRKIQYPQKKEYIKLQLQQILYNCMYGSQPNVDKMQLQAQQVQIPMPMPQHQQNYNYSVNSDGRTFASF